MLKSVPKSKIKDTAGTEKEYLVECEGKQICIKSDRFYTRKHMWAKETPEGNFRIGVTDYAQKFLREKVALVEIFKNAIVGDEVHAGEVFGAVYGRLYANLDFMRSECMAFDLSSPVGGRIVEVNNAVLENPQLLNTGPYEEGWIAKISRTQDSDINELITPAEYRKVLSRKGESPFRVI